MTNNNSTFKNTASEGSHSETTEKKTASKNINDSDSSSHSDNSEKNFDPESFGYQSVQSEERQGLVNKVFSSVADSYDVMNDVMSGGMHRLWKNDFIAWLSPPKNRPTKLIDVAGGTGDISSRFLDKAGAGSTAALCDINFEMMQAGQKRFADTDKADTLNFTQGNAEFLPFPDNSFDYYTIAFGIRNVTNIDTALNEAYRVLKPGGRFMCLEFSEMQIPIIDKFYDQFSFLVIPKMGKLIAGDEESYQYLVESIRKFPKQDAFADMIKDAKFDRVSYRNLSGGIAAMHSGWKL